MAIDTIKANAIFDGAVDTADLASGAVTTAKIATDAVTTAKIAAGQVTSAKLDTNIAVSGNLSSGGSLTSTGEFKANGGVVFNEDSLDVDFRVESNNNANMLVVDAGNDRVGVGTASPTQATLHVVGGSVPARFESTSDTTTYVQFGASATTNYGQIAMTGNDMTLRTSYTDRMKIDSNGYVTKPNQVSFFAGWATTSSPPSGYGAVNYATGFSRVGWNIGSGWNSAGTFTAPVTGKYFMFMSMGFTSGAYNMHLGFYINGGGGLSSQGNSNGDPWQQTGRGNDGSSDQDHVTVSRIFNLNANDTLRPVYLIFDNDNNAQIYQNRSFVGGYLLG